MRNEVKPFMALILVLLAAAGCGSDPQAQSGSSSSSGEGFRALERRQFAQAMAAADAQLRQDPHGPTTAETLYLKGRAFEQEAELAPHDAATAARLLQSARTAYVQALQQNPSRDLAAYVRTSLANVAYWQEDYQTAASQWSAAYDQVESPEVRSWILYRIGLSYQRLGRFNEADRAFALVQQQYPGTLPAQRAHEKQGARAFYLQVATLSSAENANRIFSQLRQEGTAADRRTDSKGRHVILAGPVPTYEQARALKQRYAAEYPDALVIP